MYLTVHYALGSTCFIVNCKICFISWNDLLLFKKHLIMCLYVCGYGHSMFVHSYGHVSVAFIPQGQKRMSGSVKPEEKTELLDTSNRLQELPNRGTGNQTQGTISFLTTESSCRVLTSFDYSFLWISSNSLYSCPLLIMYLCTQSCSFLQILNTITLMEMNLIIHLPRHVF